jgi:hypothetical protein
MVFLWVQEPGWLAAVSTPCAMTLQNAMPTEKGLENGGKNRANKTPNDLDGECF